MAWDAHTHYKGPNWEVYGLTSTLGADTFYELAHSLGQVPLVVIFTPTDSGAAGAGYWIDGETDAKVDVNKSPSGGASHIHVHLSTLRHPH